MNTPYSNFVEFFTTATRFQPYPYQEKLAESKIPSVLVIPTGAGKTEASILALWLWRRLNGDPDIPRRLVYCLPMRVLAEQTEARVNEWLKRLGLDRIKVELLLGGNDTKIQEIHPDKEYIIIGTQDMLVSGALNRAYGQSPNVWPIVFGLLNNDSMWIMDEVQIMENALPTSIQLDHFRNTFRTYGPHKTVWMSATINPDWMDTVNSPRQNLEIYYLGKNDVDANLKKRNKASKILRKSSVMLKKEYTKEDVQRLLELHKQGTTTAIITNTVKRAQALYRLLSNMDTNCKLIHSRFRNAERAELNKWIGDLTESTDCIIVSTQVLEAGVDLSVQTMITEIAPWASMVQRFGRCNRSGNLTDANVYWIDIDDQQHAPYDEKEISDSREKLDRMDGMSISPGDLPDVKTSKFFDFVPRYRDVVNLFDNMPDLSGGHTDVSRFVRNAQQKLDIDVFWRQDTSNDTTMMMQEKEEICSVPISDLKSFLKTRKEIGYAFDYDDRIWKKTNPNDLRPGQIIMLNSKTSGYSKTYGWDPTEYVPVRPIGSSKQRPESYDGDNRSNIGVAITLADHTRHVMLELDHYLENIQHIDAEIKDVLRTAARYHDVGKIHRVFQNAMQKGIIGMNGKTLKKTVWAKSQRPTSYSQPGFRHEVVSALAYLKQSGYDSTLLTDLTAYLIISHHGRVRLSIRSTKGRRDVQDNKYILGIATKGEKLNACTSDVISIPEINIDISIAKMGRDASGTRSWTERAITLRDQYGPFCLAYLEALIRRADWLASAKESTKEYDT